MSANVGILIVSHSHQLAEGAADMVRQMWMVDWEPTWERSNRKWRRPGPRKAWQCLLMSVELKPTVKWQLDYLTRQCHPA
mgnify:CR=1 FL=1